MKNLYDSNFWNNGDEQYLALDINFEIDTIPERNSFSSISNMLYNFREANLPNLYNGLITID